jgi:hypothetical protein
METIARNLSDSSPRANRDKPASLAPGVLAGSGSHACASGMLTWRAWQLPAVLQHVNTARAITTKSTMVNSGCAKCSSPRLTGLEHLTQPLS